MSLSRLCGRVARLETWRARATSASGLLVVWLEDGDTHVTALHKAGLTPADVAGRVMIFVEYEETRPDALAPDNAAATPGSPAPGCG